MPIPARRTTLPVFAALAALTGAALARSGPSEDEEARAVRRVLERQVEDWNRGDLDAFLGSYWHDPAVVFQSGGERTDGFEAMRDRYHAKYKAEGRAMGRLEF